MSGQAQIMAAEVVGAVRARNETTVALPDALRYFALYGLGAVLVYGVVTFGAIEPWSLFGFRAMAAALLVPHEYAIASSSPDLPGAATARPGPC